MNRLTATTLLVATLAGSAWAAPARKPNIIYLFADDLGYGDLGCYGQTKIKTPNLDRLAAGGMRFTQHYSGNPVCAPSRCALLTGKHTGHTYVRGNKEMGKWGPDEPEGQLPLPAAEVTLAELLQAQGYATGAFGKWGLGGPGSVGHPNRQGFDQFYGYLCQRVAHNYYPTHLWRNDKAHMLPGQTWFSSRQKIDAPPADRSGYARYKGEHYAPDLIGEAALAFIRANQNRPFFLYVPTVVPHVALQVPDDSLAQYAGTFDDKPYLGQRGYLPHPEPRAAYAAMITRMDRDMGRIMKLVKELGLDDHTLIMFSSDNGPTYAGGADAGFFNSAGPLRGLKGSVYEGGIRVPMIARWPGRIAPGTTTDHPSANWDVLPTVMEIIGADAPADIDGISFAPTLFGKPGQKKHDVLYWELRRQQAVRAGDWKLVRIADRQGRIRTELFNLRDDLAEKNNLAKFRPAELERMLRIAREARTESKEFPSPFDGGT